MVDTILFGLVVLVYVNLAILTAVLLRVWVRVVKLRDDAVHEHCWHYVFTGKPYDPIKYAHCCHCGNIVATYGLHDQHRMRISEHGKYAQFESARDTDFIKASNGNGH